MPTPTTNMALQKPVGADSARDVDKVYVAAAFDTIDAHTHAGTGTLGLKVATTAFPSGAVLPSPAITTPTISGHEHASGSAPTVAAGSGIGGGGTVSVSGSDGHHVVICNVGTAPGTQMVTVTFNAAFTTPHVIASLHGNGAPAHYTSAIGTTSYVLNFATAPTASQPYTFYVQVVDLG